MEFPGFSVDMSILEEPPRPDPSTLYDMLILGGGPAAISAAIYAARKMLTLAIVTRDFGGQVTTTSEIENYAGFQSVSGHDLANRFVEHVKNFKVPAATGESVTRVSRDGDVLKAWLEGGSSFRGKSMIFATGKRHRLLGVPGETELAGRGVAYCSICDAPFYKNRRVVVAGGGNSAFTAALDLLKVGASVTMVNLVQGWQADPVLQDALKRAGNAAMLDLHRITRVIGTERVTGVAVESLRTGRETEIGTDGVFVEIGLSPNTAPLKGLAELSHEGELVIDSHCRTSVEGLFGAGDATTVPYNQIVISAGEGAKAALAAYDHLLKKGLI